MSNTMQEQNSNTISGWDEAITRAEAEIYKMENYVRRLKAAKWVFLESKEQGLPWPGSVKAMLRDFNEKAGTAKKAIPA
jgi:hypothetical protein